MSSEATTSTNASTSATAFFQAEKSMVSLYMKSSQQYCFMIQSESTHGTTYSEYRLDFGEPSFSSSIANDGVHHKQPEVIQYREKATYDARVSELDASGYHLIQTVITQNMPVFMVKCQEMFSKMSAMVDICDNLRFSAKIAEIPFTFDMPPSAMYGKKPGCSIL